MPVFEIREKFTVLYRVVVDDREAAIARWKETRSRDEHGNLTEPAQAMLDLLDRDLQNLPADIPEGLRKKLAVMPVPEPGIREVSPAELQNELGRIHLAFNGGLDLALLL